MRRCIVCTCVVIQNRTNRVGGVVIISVFLPIVVGRGLSMVRRKTIPVKKTYFRTTCLRVSMRLVFDKQFVQLSNVMARRSYIH
jgi:hypothetical protein